MAFTETFIQVAVDGTGKMVRNLSNLISGNTVYQQVVSRAKSDGTLMDDEATETTLGAIKAKTDNLDVLLSTRTKPADNQTVNGTVTANVGTTNGLALDATVSGVAKDATVVGVAKDATLGTLADRPAAYSVLDRLNQIGLKLDRNAKLSATDATLQQVLLALKPLRPQSPSTLLHRS